MMKRKIIPMSIAELEVLEKPFGWKVEYWDGRAHFTPREVGVTTRINLSPRCRTQPHHLIPFDSTYTEEAIAGYFEAFIDSVEFCDWTPEQVQDSAEKCLRNYFAGKRGTPLPASVIALEPDTQKLAGLALFILKQEQQPCLDLLYVRSEFQRRGMATAMLDWGINCLIESNFLELFSAYHICNDRSRLWHHKYGFEDVYDPFYVRLKYGWLKQEIWRRERLGLDMGTLVQERDEWQSKLDTEDLY